MEIERFLYTNNTICVSLILSWQARLFRLPKREGTNEAGAWSKRFFGVLNAQDNQIVTNHREPHLCWILLYNVMFFCDIWPSDSSFLSMVRNYI